MSRPQDDKHVDAMLRHLAGDDAPPTDDELTLARAKLDAAILAETTSQSHRRARGLPRRPLVAAVGMALVVAVVAGSVLVARPAPLAAALAEYAEVVLETEPLEPVEGEFILQTTELAQLVIVDGSLLELDAPEIAYIIIEQRKTWVGADGIIQMASTPTETRFFSGATAAAYENANMAEFDDIGMTTTVRQEGDDLSALPTDVEALEAFLREQIRLGGTELPEDVLLYDELASILGDPVAPPEVRAAAALTLNSIDGIELVQKNETQIVVALEYLDPIRVRHTLELDLSASQLTQNTTQLLEDHGILGIPASTIINQTNHDRLVVTTDRPPTS
ncbi:MAG: hypothetical protein GY926_23410 [bacterium]|nr:hypothetical protein [bacterium]